MTDASSPALPLDRDTVVVVSRDAVSAELEQETIILGMRDGVYFGLDNVGTRIWSIASAPVTLAAIHAAIVAEYDVPAERAWSDLVAVVHDLLAAGLLERRAQP